MSSRATAIGRSHDRNLLQLTPKLPAAVVGTWPGTDALRLPDKLISTELGAAIATTLARS